MSQPQHKATTREALRQQYGYSKRTFARILKRAGISHRRTVLTPREAADCYSYLVEGQVSAASAPIAPIPAN